MLSCFATIFIIEQIFRDFASENEKKLSKMGFSLKGMDLLPGKIIDTILKRYKLQSMKVASSKFVWSRFNVDYPVNSKENWYMLVLLLLLLLLFVWV